MNIFFSPAQKKIGDLAWIFYSLCLGHSPLGTVLSSFLASGHRWVSHYVRSPWTQFPVLDSIVSTETDLGPIQSLAKSNPRPCPCPCFSTDIAHVCCTHPKPKKKNASFFFLPKITIKKGFRVFRL